MIAFIGGSEMIIAAVVGLLLFGGRLPEVMRQVGKVWFGFRRSLNDLKRETGLEDALRDIRREANSVRDIASEFRTDMDPFAGPAKETQAEDVEVEHTGRGWSSPTETVADGDDVEGDADETDVDPDADPDGKAVDDPDEPKPAG
jgi:Sec-independent protein translocase protein TatA